MSSRICLSIILSFFIVSFSFVAEAQIKGKVNNAKAGYYGSPDGKGTSGGACGYGSKAGSIYTASVNSPLWNNGFICGSCYSIKCTGKCKSKTPVVIKVTNFCDPKDTQCSYTSNAKFDVSMPVFQRMAKSLSDTPISISYQRVSCKIKTAIRFTVSKNANYINILVSNIAQYGNLQKLEFKNSGSSKWIAFNRIWGANWAYSGNLKFPLALRLTSAVNRKVLTTGNKCIPVTNGDATYTCRVQF